MNPFPRSNRTTTQDRPARPQGAGAAKRAAPGGTGKHAARTAWATVAGLAAPALLLMAGAPTASASAPGERAGAEQHCTYDVETTRTACFDSLPAAVAAVSEQGQSAGGARTLAADDRPDGSVILGTFFTETGFGGSTYTVWGGSPCEADGKMNWNMGSFPDWARSTNSLQTWANCGIYVYSEENLQGERDGRFDGNIADIGPLLGDRVASASFH